MIDSLYQYVSSSPFVLGFTCGIIYAVAPIISAIASFITKGGRR
ncbi:Phage protein [Fusobacterium necrophorum subsp. funduliforme]|nr:hypothetical protein [Fusobacterium necrophorum]MDY2572665.1 hypothetical protein [Fusobacterium necrophorum]